MAWPLKKHDAVGGCGSLAGIPKVEGGGGSHTVPKLVRGETLVLKPAKA